MSLAVSDAAAVQFFGWKLLLSWMKEHPKTGNEWDFLKAWLVELLDKPWDQCDVFVRNKAAEAVVVVAKADWPGAWPQLTQVLLGEQTLSRSLCGLQVWSQLAESLPEVSVKQRRQISNGLVSLLEEPKEAPHFVVKLQAALQSFGGDERVLREVLNLCGALPHAVPMRLLLKNQFDKIVQVGLQSKLGELALTALAEWVQQLRSSKDGAAMHDLCRLLDMLLRLVEKCSFQEDAETYRSHQQICRLLSELCSSQSLPGMPKNELSRIWKALLQLLRYPSGSLQVDAIQGMLALARQGSTSLSLEELVKVLYVLGMKPVKAFSKERSSFLSHCLGTDFDTWYRCLSMSGSFEMLDIDLAGRQMQSQWLCAVKNHSRELLIELCGPESFAHLVQVAGGLLARSLAADASGGWLEECDSAMWLVEGVALGLLKGSQASSVASAMQSFLQQVCVRADVPPAIEYRRLEFLSTCSPFYVHWDDATLQGVLSRIFDHVRNPWPQTDGMKLEPRALDTLVSMCKAKALTQHLEQLHNACRELSPLVSPAGRSRLLEAMATTVACSELERGKKLEIMRGSERFLF